METEQITSDVNQIFKDVMENDNIKVNDGTTAKDIEEWDSLTNIQLIVAIEKHFKIRFTSLEIQGFKNVGEMCITIKAKVAA